MWLRLEWCSAGAEAVAEGGVFLLKGLEEGWSVAISWKATGLGCQYHSSVIAVILQLAGGTLCFVCLRGVVGGEVEMTAALI